MTRLFTSTTIRLVASTLLCLCLSPFTSAQSRLEPPDGQFYLGAWVDTQPSTRPGIGNDLPVLMNYRMGMNFSSFQLVQDIPIPTVNRTLFNITRLDETSTDAILFLTINNYAGLAAITDADLNYLADQLYNVTEIQKRNVMLRFLPEMNGYWYAFGAQPTAYVRTWIRMSTIMRSKAPRVALVWSPNHSVGYPYGSDFSQRSPEDIEALDTNGNGVFDNGDDPFTPFYPGDEHVDWVGLSIYWKGNTPPYNTNEVAPPSFLFDQIQGGGPTGGNPTFNFYTMFTSPPRSKPFAISETAAAFYLSSDTLGPLAEGVGHLAVARSYWRQLLTNNLTFNRFPKLKFISIFEFQKHLEQSGDYTERDYRITTNQTIAQAFVDDFYASGVVERVVRPNYREFVVRVPPAPGTGAVGTTGRKRNGGVESMKPLKPQSPAAIVCPPTSSDTQLKMADMARNRRPKKVPSVIPSSKASPPTSTPNMTRKRPISVRSALYVALFSIIFGPMVYNHIRLLTVPLPANQFGPAGSTSHLNAARDAALTSQGVIKGFNGHPIFVSTAGPQRGKPVLLVHGYPETGLMSWRAQIPALAEEGYFVIVPDLRGFNGSYSETERKKGGWGIYNALNAAEDLKIIMETVAPGRRVCVAAHDWGTVPAWDYVVRFPNKIACLMILDGPHPLAYIWHVLQRPSDFFVYSWYIIWDFTFGSIYKSAERLGAYNDWDWMVKWWPGTSKPGTFSVDDVKEFKKVWAQEGVMTSMLAWYRHIPRMLFSILRYRNTQVPWGHLPSNIPAVTFWGTKDAYLPVSLVETTIPFAPHMKNIIIENGTHWVQHEEPMKVNKELLKLLERGRWR
ncbi:hypothetical protein HDV05_000595 [Chytridiales sp. JEL 0842]|nr:hypothetical protein HDV05_000595 [Chytridiales sp. JEL 0842]